MISIHLLPTPSTPPHPHTYQVAGYTLVTDIPLVELAPFAATEACHSDEGGIWSLPAPDSSFVGMTIGELNDHWNLIYQDVGWLGNEWRKVACWSSAVHNAYRLAVEGAGLFEVAANGDWIAYRGEPFANHPQQVPTLIIEILLGPALLLAFAAKGTWALHASAVAIGGQVIAFMGESGVGKSTLARFLDQEAKKYNRLADDLLPVEYTANGLLALPHFPQLKLPFDKQVRRDSPSRLSVDAIYVLEACHESAKLERSPLSAREATLMLVRHTIASRLFDQNLLTKHLSFCAQTAIFVPIYRLTYPHDMKLLPRVVQLITKQG